MPTLLDTLTHASLPMPLPELQVVPDHMQIFMFSAITWNRHHVHYSKDAAISEGLPDVVVQRALLGDFLARAVGEWAGDEADLRELSWKVRSSATPGARLRCQGSVTAVHAGDGDGAGTFAECELRIVRDDDQLVASGSARLELVGADPGPGR
jgi:hydroxyacyl-ACP dehydratase HTD2-like protein with hotdog domain